MSTAYVGYTERQRRARKPKVERHPTSEWTSERIAAIKAWQADGLSAGQMAERLGGVTRNAVIGKLHRMGLAGKYQTAGRRVTRSSRRRPKSVKATVWHSCGGHVPTVAKGGRRRVEMIAFDAEPLPLPAVTDIPRVAFADLTDTHCKWIVGDVRPVAMCCGAPRVPGQPYCHGHMSRAYQSPQPRQRASTKEAADATA